MPESKEFVSIIATLLQRAVISAMLADGRAELDAVPGPDGGH
jgi:hypothetical protein